jgi:hypothetical protein
MEKLETGTLEAVTIISGEKQKPGPKKKTPEKDGPRDLTPIKPTVFTDPKDLYYQRERDNKLVRGKFMFLECPGDVLRFAFKKYKEDPLVFYELKDNTVYTLPRMVAKHLNENCWYPEYSYIQGEAGVYETPFADGSYARVTRKKHRAEFKSLEFTDEEHIGPTPDLVVASAGTTLHITSTGRRN